MRFVSETPDSISNFCPDIAICALGYESRCTEVAKRFFRSRRIGFAIGFGKNLEFDYEKNSKFFEEEGFSIYRDVGDEEFSAVLDDIFNLDALSRRGEPINVAIDISSFDRFRLASIVTIVHGMQKLGTINEVAYFYSVGLYARPSSDFSYNTRLHPVHPSFVGTRPDPLAPISAIIGLGYEREKAIGAAEFLEASDVFAFLPKSAIAEYYISVQQSNALLLHQLSSHRKIDYSVADPAALVFDLSSVVRGLARKSSVIMIPLGPKIFALACMLTARLHPNTSVWRMSQIDSGRIQNRLESGYFSILRVVK